MQPSAILWDYDGTLADSTLKNIEVTMEVLRKFIPDIETHMPEALTSVDKYQEANYTYKNWRELYSLCFGLSEEQVDEAGRLWSPYQLSNPSTAHMFPGIPELLKHFVFIKHGICSQNCSQNIRKTLRSYGVEAQFCNIIGCDDISYGRQKPDPAGFLKCLSGLWTEAEKARILQAPTKLIYIGDHQDDIAFAKNAERRLRSSGYPVEVSAVSVLYSGSRPDFQTHKPDYIAHTVEELGHILNSLCG